VHFDDRLKTTLSGLSKRGNSPLSQWRQIVDLLAQDPKRFENDDVTTAFVTLHGLSQSVSQPDKTAAISALQGRLKSPALIAYFCADSHQLGAAAIAAGNLRDQQWADLVPRISGQARGFLRNKRNLGEETQQALSRYASVDFVLQDFAADRVVENTPNLPLAEPEPSLGTDERAVDADDNDPPVGAKISELVKRIATYQQMRESGEAPQLPLGGASQSIEPVIVRTFNFETDDLGTIIWSEGVPRGAIVGTSINMAAFDDGPGPDAAGAAAFKQRSPLENARLRLCGSPIIEGDWRMNAIPYFEQQSGRFRGYRGIVRRPDMTEEPSSEKLPEQNNDYLRQLIHELRTPLNAIIGFSEIIEQQLFGPVSFDYRSIAGDILKDAERLLAGFDDLDVAAKMESGAFEVDEGVTDPEWLFNRLLSRLQGITVSNQVELNISKAEPLRNFAADSDTVERVFSRLLSATIMSCGKGEQINATLKTEIGVSPSNQFTISRPLSTSGLTEDELLDPSFADEMNRNDAPLLGLGFSLRLVRSLAEAISGNLMIQEVNIVLTLPAVAHSELAEQNGVQ